MSEKIIEYGMATGYSTKELLLIVQAEIQNGFQPFGQPFTTIEYNISYVHQAMVMYDVKKKTKAK